MRALSVALASVVLALLACSPPAGGEPPGAGSARTGTAARSPIAEQMLSCDDVLPPAELFAIIGRSDAKTSEPQVEMGSTYCHYYVESDASGAHPDIDIWVSTGPNYELLYFAHSDDARPITGLGDAAVVDICEECTGRDVSVRAHVPGLAVAATFGGPIWGDPADHATRVVRAILDRLTK